MKLLLPACLHLLVAEGKPAADSVLLLLLSIAESDTALPLSSSLIYTHNCTILSVSSTFKYSISISAIYSAR
jgi:hypothetical protein